MTRSDVKNGDDDGNIDVNVGDVSEASGKIASLGMSQGSF